MKVQAAHASHYEWLSMKTGCAITSDFSAIEAVDEMDRVRGMVGFCNTTHNAIQAHVAVKTPIAFRALVPAAMDYAFNQAQKGILLAVIPAHNRSSVRLVKHLRFKLTHIIQDGWDLSDDLLFFELRKEDWFAKHETITAFA